MNLKDVDHWDDLEVDGKTILKLSLHKQDGDMLVGFVLLRIRTSGGLTRCTTISFSRTRNALRREILNVMRYLKDMLRRHLLYLAGDATYGICGRPRQFTGYIKTTCEHPNV